MHIMHSLAAANAAAIVAESVATPASSAKRAAATPSASGEAAQWGVWLQVKCGTHC